MRLSACRNHAHRLCGALLLLLLATPTLAKETLVTVQGRDGVDQRFLLIKPDQPKATVILFAGGKGTLKLRKSLFGVDIAKRKKNFLVRTRKMFADQDLMVAVVDAPADHQGKRGMLGGFRTSDDHVADIDAVIAHLRGIADIPIWLVGTSRGTESAAYIAIHSKQRPAGVVLTSSMTEPNRKGDAVTELPLLEIKLPVLITHHREDGCRVTVPDSVPDILAMLTNAAKVEIAWFEGGRTKGNPCKAMSYHGYLGIEKKVVKRIADFVKAN